MEFRVLGPLEVVADGRVVVLKAAKPRALLAMLLLRVGEPVAADRLIEDLWAGRPPATAAKVLQTYVSRLRKALGEEAIVTGPGGYELRVEADGVDLHRFERLVREAREAEPAAAAQGLREALALWRGPALAEFAYESWAQGEIGRLGELRLSALQDRIDADLALGRAGELVGELERLVAEHPLSERLRGQLMLALYRSGRQAEALDAYRAARVTLVEQLGIEPGSALRSLERAILGQDPALDIAAASVGTPPASRLRSRSTSFVGREREQQEIRVLLRGGDVRLLTLTGPGGTGKTRLAVEAIAALGADFPDGVVFVDLAPVGDADLVAAAIAAALGLTDSSGRGAHEALIASLRRQRVLLVLDNFEQVLSAGAMLTNLLAGAPSLTILVTSRAPLDIPDERIYRVAALELPEAVRLFTARARDARSDFELTTSNADAVDDLCVRLDGLPLAIELAAARIKLLSPAEILERLGVRLEVLKAEPGAGLPERHRTLRAAIEWSYDLLADDERGLFTSLGVFVGGFTLEGARAVVDDIDVVSGVEALLNNSLLRTEPMAAGEPRFGMLETIREYAVERLKRRGDGLAVRSRHAGFYVRVAEAAEAALLGPQQVSWLRRLDAEHDNLRAALTWATEEDAADAGLRIGAALWRYWQLRGFASEGRERLEGLLALGSGSEEARAKALSRTASLAFVTGDHEAVCRYGDASLSVFRRLGDDADLVYTLGLIGNSALALGDIDLAHSAIEEAVGVARGSGDPMIESYAHYNAGVVRAWHGELDEAERLIEESVRGAGQLGNIRSVANWGRSLGGIALARRDYASARSRFEESLELHRTLDDSWGISHSLTSLALLLVEARDGDAARRLVAESVALELKSGDWPGIVFNLEVCARLAAEDGDHHRAVRLYACASSLRGPVGTHPSGVGWPNPEAHAADLRSAFDEEAFAEAWAEGLAMSTDEALAYALAQDV